MAYNFTAIEKKWQRYWLENKTFAALDPAEAGDMPKSYVLDMFPYPSGAGLHVGHPEGYTATDITARYLRMKGVNVLHPMGWDAFGLPAEQYAVKNNIHPAETTHKNIDTFRRQIQSLGLSYDWDREINTTDPAYYRWTQWIFLQLFNSYFDPLQNKALPIARLLHELENETYVVAPDGSVHLNPAQDGIEEIAPKGRVERLWHEIGNDEKDDILDNLRLAYTDEAPVNWCPGLGTVLSNEEVIEGKSEVGGYAVERRPLRQWMLRITAYADRLLADLDGLDWPESLKDMQRNWIGKSIGAEVDFEIVPPVEMQQIEAENPDANQDLGITVFTTRPDTLHGATYLVLAPEHPLVDQITPAEQQQAVGDYRTAVESKSDRERMTDARDKTGVFTGAYAINPVNQATIPIWISDYVLMGYGTGAIMAVPAHDQRDFEFANKFGLPMKAVVSPSDDWLKTNGARAKTSSTEVKPPENLEPDEKAWMKSWNAVDQLSRDHVAAAALTGNVDDLRTLYLSDCRLFPMAFTGDGVAVNSPGIDGLETAEAIDTIIKQLQGDSAATPSVKFKLRDWLFSRQRYWGEPFPIAMDKLGNTVALDDGELPLLLPEMEDFKPTGTPEPPLSKAVSWINYERDGVALTRETNTMPQWAGSCWYYLRYIDPKNSKRFVDPEKEKYWMPVDLYVGGVEHAVLHLLYARFWHKVLFDLGHVSSPEPFKKLVNQGLILGETEYHLFVDEAGKTVSLNDVRDVTEEATPEGSRMIGSLRSNGSRVIGQRVEEDLVEKHGDGYVLKTDRSIKVDGRSFKMSKSRGNVVNPDSIVADYGADTFRLYEMYLGPLEQQKPWNTRDIVGMSRFLSSVYRNLIGDDDSMKQPMHPTEPSGSAAGSPAGSSTGPTSNSSAPKVTIIPTPEALDHQLHRTIKKVGTDIEALHFNTAIAELIKLNNAITGMTLIPRELAETFTLLLSPFAPHLAEELWHRLGHHKSLSRRPWPMYDEQKLVESTIELPVQVDGKVRDKITVAADTSEDDIFKIAIESEKVAAWLAGKPVKKKLYVPKRLVNFVTG